MRLPKLPFGATDRVGRLSPEIKLYLGILALTAFGLGFSNDILSNYFKEAYRATTYQRGVIEFPRELPGILTTFVIALLAGFSDVRIAIVAQVLGFAGIAVLGFWTPAFSVMLLFIFVNSLGQHLFMPLQDSIGMSLAGRQSLGKRMGQFKGVTIAFQMTAAIVVFLGFRSGLFSFESETKWPFVVSAAVIAITIVLILSLDARLRDKKITHERVRFVVRKEYRLYYALVVMFGVQKQIMLVYGPWVIIELLGKRADTIAILVIAGSALGMLFMPALGRWLDRFGIKKMLYVDALSFIGVYLLYGIVSGGYASGAIPTAGWTVLLAYGIFILDRMSTQMGIIRTVYLRTIAVDPRDVTPTLSLGMSMDHVVSIACAFAGGIVWTLWGPQYIFYLASALSLVNLYVAVRVKLPEGK